MSDVTLSKAVRSNLLHLQNTAKMMDVTQERLATGKKVNSALDNPTNFFTAASLNGRAADISALLDAMGSGIRTIEAADNGLTSMTKTLESMQSVLRQARQDNSFKMESYNVTTPEDPDGDSVLNLSGGSLPEGADFDIDLYKAQSQLEAGAFPPAGVDMDTAGDQFSFEIAVNGGSPVTITVTDADIGSPGAVNNPSAVTADELAALINTKLQNQNVGAAVTVGATGLVFTTTEADAASTADIEISNYTGTATGIADGAGTTVSTRPRTVDDFVNALNSNPDLKGSVRASNDNGRLRIENLSTSALQMSGFTNGNMNGGVGQTEIGGNDSRSDLARQFNDLRTELDRIAEDASFNGVNLLRGDQLKIVFNESGTSTIEIQTKNAKGETRAVNAANLGLNEIFPEDLDLNDDIDGLLSNLQNVLNEVRSQASALGSTLSVVQNREDFTKRMINTLETGAANLTLADTNEESANMLALQTRQQLSQTALSLASQADQAVLRLFG
ncbi:flagellin [Pelagibacterium sp. 26DY04]|uniref:flagellin N-terminal helical domain-containing protein n=1 Tax=Pelagibacterium sp. 26DY04 TaxID=2967130 RepID=UPI0028165583|nr:flagellin [Pelagibacterium sp. 26DY04]WMT85728.1 flagellin [Pelagibacterium sp. 26DY04]